MKVCILCLNPFKDYNGKNRSRCGSCNTRIRRFRAKAAAIKYLGGKCHRCGWRGGQAAFQFHHKDPNKKDFVIGNVGNKSWDRLKMEMKKCVLLCANCHIMMHSTRDDKRLIKEALNYKGRKLDF